MKVTDWESDLGEALRGTGWTAVGDVPLTTITRTDSLAVKTVTTLVPRGTKLRVVMSDDQTGDGYIDGHSNFVVK